LEFDTSISINPANFTAYYSRGISKNNLRDFTGAIQDYNKALEILKKNAKKYQQSQMDTTLIRASQFALESFEKDIKYNKGTAEYNQNDYLAAIQSYDEAVKIDSLFVKAYNSRGEQR